MERMAIIAVDMTPVLPDGRNGGAKIFALELLKSLRATNLDDRFLILTASWNHQHLSVLDSGNMSRLCVLKQQNSSIGQEASHPDSKIPKRLRKMTAYLRERIRPISSGRPRLRELGVDLLFCPFTAPTFAVPGIPVVSVIYDLQHLAYPHFFTAREISTRRSFLEAVERKVDHVVCISEGVQRSVCDSMDIDPGKTHVVPISVHSRLPRLDPSAVKKVLRILGIDRSPYMFYPANFWLHKNHRMLLSAFGMFLSKNEANAIELVFTGTIEDEESELRYAVQRMGLGDRVHFLGYLETDQLAAVWEGCEFLIFPSLYEGFGIPLLEAMYFGKPILCSNLTSIPEVAQDAALYFDPRNPGEIVQCLEEIIHQSETRDIMIQRGDRRVSEFHPSVITSAYSEVFASAIKKPRPLENEMTGLYHDNWTREEISITYRSGGKDRLLEIRMEAPGFIPAPAVRVTIEGPGRNRRKWKIRRGERVTIRHDLPEQEGTLTLTVKPTFRPLDYQMGDDNRQLGLICHACRLVSPSRDETSVIQRRGP